MSLRIASGLSLPLEFVTQTAAVIAKRRAGKSYTMRRIVEQLFKAHQQVVLVDPKGDQWGLRSSADGKGPGLPIIILGGERGDVPLEVHAGEMVAKLVVEERVSVLLDLAQFRKHEVATFMTAFMENLYRLKAREVYRTPMMLVIDEADAVAPQKPQKGEERMLGAAEDLVRRGGQRGIGCVLVTQRSAVLNKNVLTQAQVLIVLRTIAPQDLAAMDAWIEVHGEPAQRKILMDSLPSLPVGDAWFWSPGWPTVDGIFKRVHVLPIETFDSGASPAPGVARVEPKNLADVDLNALKGQMAATIEKAKANDPRELQKRIVDLERRLLAAEHVTPETERPAKAPSSVLTAADRQLLASFDGRLSDTMDAISATADRVLTSIGEVAKAEIDAAVESWTAEVAKARLKFIERLEQVGFQKVLDKLKAVSTPQVSMTIHPSVVPPKTRTALESVARHVVAGNGTVKGGKFNAMLVVMAQAGRPLSDTQVAARAVMALSGTFDKYLSQQRANGWVDGTRQALTITQAGLKALGAFEPLPTGEALRHHWLNELGQGGKRQMLEGLIDAYPKPLPDEEVAKRAGIALSGTFDKYLSQLRRLQLIEGPRQALRASEELF